MGRNQRAPRLDRTGRRAEYKASRGIPRRLAPESPALIARLASVSREAEELNRGTLSWKPEAEAVS